MSLSFLHQVPWHETVKMTCSWGDLAVDKHITWYRKTEHAGTELIMTAYGVEEATEEINIDHFDAVPYDNTTSTKFV